MGKVLDFKTHKEIFGPETLRVQAYLEQAKSWNRNAAGVFIMLMNKNGEPTHCGSTGCKPAQVSAGLSSYMTKILKEALING